MRSLFSKQWLLPLCIIAFSPVWLARSSWAQTSNIGQIRAISPSQAATSSSQLSGTTPASLSEESISIFAQSLDVPSADHSTTPRPSETPSADLPAEPDSIGGFPLDPYLSARGQEVISVQVRFLNPRSDQAFNETLRKQILSTFPLLAGDSFNGTEADAGIARIQENTNVATVRYQVLTTASPGRVRVLVEVRLKPAPLTPVPESQMPSSFGVFAKGGNITQFPLLYQNSRSQVVAPLYGAIGIDANYNPWFGNSTQFPNVNGAPLPQLPKDTLWGEAYVNQSLYGIYQLADRFYIYGGLSAQLTSSFGFDTYAYKPRDRAYLALNEGFVGLLYGEKRTETTEPWGINFSYGQQNFRIGTGMLIWQGTQNGGNRGVLALNTRQSFSNTLIGRFRYGNLKLQGFYLESNPLDISPTQTNLAGANLEYTIDNRLNLGFSYIGIPDSQIPTRKGLNTFDFRFWAVPFQHLPGFFLAGEYAFQRNKVNLGIPLEIAAQGGYIQIGNRFTNANWKPQISYRFASFSGDNPSTQTKLEKFDSLYYGGDLTTWYQGLNFAYVVPNSNEITHQFIFSIQPAQNLNLSLQYILIYANEAFQTLPTSPALPSRFLGQEVNLSVLWNITPKFILSFTGAISFPGSAFKDADFLPNKPRTWTGLGLNFIWSF